MISLEAKNSNFTTILAKPTGIPLPPCDIRVNDSAGGWVAQVDVIISSVEDSCADPLLYDDHSKFRSKQQEIKSKLVQFRETLWPSG